MIITEGAFTYSSLHMEIEKRNPLAIVLTLFSFSAICYLPFDAVAPSHWESGGATPVFSLAHSELFCTNPSRPPFALHTLAAVPLSFITVVTFESAFVATAGKWCDENVICIHVNFSVDLSKYVFK